MNQFQNLIQASRGTISGLTLVVSSLLISISAFATVGGTDVGRGGDSIALDFKSVALFDVNLIQKHSPAFDGIIDVARLKAMIETTTIAVEDRVFLADVEKDALNFSNPDRIVISSTRWRQLPLNDPRKSALVLHEYISLMGVDDSSYAVSSLLLDVMKTHTRSILPLYTCTLIKDPKRMPEYLQMARVGGKGESDIAHLNAGTMQVQIYLGDTGMGTDVLMTMTDAGDQVGMLELPHIREFPPTIDLYAAGVDKTFWQVHCAN